MSALTAVADQLEPGAVELIGDPGVPDMLIAATSIAISLKRLSDVAAPEGASFLEQLGGTLHGFTDALHTVLLNARN